MTNPQDLTGSQDWTVLDQKSVYSSPPWVEVTKEKIQTDDGRIVDEYHQVDFPNFSVIFAETPDGKVLAIEQYKHGARRVSITLPGGGIDPGESPEVAARRELLEETGYQVDDIQHLGSYFLHGNFGCGEGHFYRATGAKQVQEADSGDLETMEIVLMDKEDLRLAVTDGRVAFTGVVTGIMLGLNAQP